jgi:hypothetical protein
MKGIVFDAVLDAVEAEHGLVRRESVLEAVADRAGGVYTSVGTYDDAELVAIVVEVARQTERDVPTTLRALGRAVFPRLVAHYPPLPAELRCTFGMARALESIIHAEVRKLYPDARPPVFACEQAGKDRLRVLYRSSRALSLLAVGLFEGCAAHFGEEVEVEHRLLRDDGTEAELMLRLRSGGAGGDD